MTARLAGEFKSVVVKAWLQTYETLAEISLFIATAQTIVMKVSLCKLNGVNLCALFGVTNQRCTKVSPIEVLVQHVFATQKRW